MAPMETIMLCCFYMQSYMYIEHKHTCSTLTLELGNTHQFQDPKL